MPKTDCSHPLRKSLVLLITASFSLLLPAPAPAEGKKAVSAAHYARLAGLYGRYFRLEEEFFETLAFAPAEKQPATTGNAFKVALVDDRGDRWIFKEGGYNRVAAHKIYALFGVDNPEIHYTEIILNGKPLKGTLQRYVSPSHPLNRHRPSDISPQGLRYLMQAQIMDWLLRDYDAHFLNFLVLSSDKDGKADRLMRIDQDCACTDSERSDLDYPGLVAVGKAGNKNVQGNVYCRIREAYARKEAVADPAQACAFVAFIEEFPAPLFEAIVWEAKTSVRRAPGDGGFAALKKQHAFFWDSLSERKRMLSEDFMNFCSGIGLPPGNTRQDNDAKALMESASGKFRKGIADLSGKLRGSRNHARKKPIQIDALVSRVGFKIMQEFYAAYRNHTMPLQAACDIALRALENARATASPCEQKALALYAEDVNNILRGKSAHFAPDPDTGAVNPSPENRLSTVP